MIKVIKNELKDPLIFWGLSMIANFFNWLHFLFSGRILTKEDFSGFAVFLSFQSLLIVFANALSATVSRFIAYYSEKKESQKQFYFFRQYWWLSWTMAATTFFLFWISRDYFKSFFGFHSIVPIVVFALISLPLFLLYFETGILFGRMAFIWVGLIYVVEAVAKFILLLFAPVVAFPTLTLATLSLFFSTSLAWAASVFIGRSFHPLPIAGRFKNKNEILEMYKFLGSSFLVGLGIVLIYNLNIILVKHFFSSTDAALYAALSILGKILYFGSGGLVSFLIPLVARAEAKKETQYQHLAIILAIVAFLGGAIFFSYLLFPKTIVQLLLEERGAAILPYLGRYSLAILFLVLANCFATFNLAKRNYMSACLLAFMAVFQAVFIFFFHDSLLQVINIILGSAFLLLVVLTANEIIDIRRKAKKELFVKSGNKKQKINILVLNWRDIHHPQAGGAEVYLNELLKRLVLKNYNVYLFTAEINGQERKIINGVNIIRKGGFFTVYFWAAIYYLFNSHPCFDLIIDCENGIPFFSPLYSKKPVIFLVYHVHHDVFNKSLMPPFSWLAIFLEVFLTPLIYKKSFVISISHSTAEDLEREIGLASDKIIKCGVDADIYRPCAKSKIPLFCYVGRIKAYKSLEVLLNAFKLVVKKAPRARLKIAGEGDWRSFLERKVEELDLKDKVDFLGRVSEEEKIALMGKSWAMINPSYKEGWGITCLEANACGTLVVASRVEGLKEAICEGVSGYLFQYGNVEELSSIILYLIRNKKKVNEMGESARLWSLQFCWDEQAEKLNLAIRQVLGFGVDRVKSRSLIVQKEEKWIESLLQ